MAPSIKQSARAAKLGEAAARLNKAADSAAKQVQEIERYLEECSLGIGSAVQVRELDNNAAEWLLYTRPPSGKSWRIVVNVVDASGEDISVKLWSDCDRETKMRTFVCIPKLFDKLIERVHEKAAQTEAALASVNALDDDDIPF